MKCIKFVRPLRLTILCLFLNLYSSYGQVGIGTTTPSESSILDINSTSKGVLIPRISLNSLSDTSTIDGTEENGLLIYNLTSSSDLSEGFYYWNTTQWIRLETNAWSLKGNSNIDPSSNYLGTNDSRPLIVKTNLEERLRVNEKGQLILNNTTAFDTGIRGELLAINAIGRKGIDVRSDDQIAGQFRSNYSTSIEGSSQEAYGSRFSSENYIGTRIATTNGYSGLISEVLNDAQTTQNYGIISRVGNGMGVGLVAYNEDTYTGGFTVGVVASQGLDGQWNTSPDFGTGISTTGEVGLYSYGLGYNEIKETFSAYFTTDYDNDHINGDGPIAKLSGKIPTSNMIYGGYFNTNTLGGSYTWTGVKYSGTNYKILGNGVVSTIVKDSQNNNRIMFASESPEVLFEDFGIGQLINGKCSISLDPILAKNITVNQQHPLKVFIQLEGQCNGVYVTEKSTNGFKVIELNQGQSNCSFSWHIVANRKNEANENQITASYEDLRFPIGPTPKENTKIKSSKIIVSK